MWGVLLAEENDAGEDATALPSRTGFGFSHQQRGAILPNLVFSLAREIGRVEASDALLLNRAIAPPSPHQLLS